MSWQKTYMYQHFPVRDIPPSKAASSMLYLLVFAFDANQISSSVLAHLSGLFPWWAVVGEIIALFFKLLPAFFTFPAQSGCEEIKDFGQLQQTTVCIWQQLQVSSNHAMEAKSITYSCLQRQGRFSPLRMISFQSIFLLWRRIKIFHNHLVGLTFDDLTREQNSFTVSRWKWSEVNRQQSSLFKNMS